MTTKSLDKVLQSNEMCFLKKHYITSVVPNLMSKFAYSNIFQVPKIEKISINIGVGKYASDKNIIFSIFSDLEKISGRKPVISKAKHSNAGFSIREGMDVGMFVTLRGNFLYEFLERFTYVALTRVKDFKGFSPKSFDTCGNFSCGIPDRQVFPEANNQLMDRCGLGIVVTTTAKTKEESRELLKLMNIPFKTGG